MKTTVTTEQKTLLRILQSALQDRVYTGPFPENLDWAALAKESEDQAVAALAFFAVEHSAIPAEHLLRWRNMALKECAHQTWVSKAHSDISALFDQNGIDAVTIKGCASAAYFPHPEYRSLGDVDFYVAPENHEKGNALLLENGFRPGARIGHHDRDYFKNNIHYEMHFAISGVPRGREGEPFLRQLEGLLRDRRTIDTNMGPAVVPSDFHHGLIILLHTASHLLSEGIGLRHLCDWAAFVNHFSDDGFCTLFQEKYQMLSLWRFAQVLTKTCERHLGLAPRDWSGDVEEWITDGCIKEFLTSGDGGREKEDKLGSGMLVSDNFSARLSKGSRWQRLLSTASGVVEMHWPASKRYRVLLPLGWGWFGTRYLVRMLLGKRRQLPLAEMSKEAEERRKLYSEFGLN